LRSTGLAARLILAGLLALLAFAGAASARGDGGRPLPNSPVADTDPFFVNAAPPLPSGPGQWNLRQIRVPEAHAVTGGSPEVVVGVLDTGVDYTHPDLAGRISFEDSVSCVGGQRDRDPAAWRDDNGHGTHNAAMIAAGVNGLGIEGVAPNVKVASIKVVDSSGLITPEAVVCAFKWAAARKLDVTNNSYTIDVGPTVTNPSNPLDLFCRSDPDRSRASDEVADAVAHAMAKGVTVIASAGNSNADVPAAAGSDCTRLPSGLPGVITVAGTGTVNEKGAYSNYGTGFIDIAAPGGNVPPAPPAGFILSAWPTACSTCPVDPGNSSANYRYMAGTSSAAAEVSGVAALVVSLYGDGKSPGNGHMRPADVSDILLSSAHPLACPPAPTTCTGTPGANSYFGHGLVDAFAALGG
jgi:lantibiotic leader peptide-processing serine protease